MAWKNDQVSEKETDKILEVARDSLEVEGDFVELGCYKGDTSLLLAEVLRDFNTKPVEKTVENFVKKVQKSAKKVLIFSYVYAII